jgi:processive 1,2-diacylglycerol beta-glucosyltransferase
LPNDTLFDILTRRPPADGAEELRGKRVMVLTASVGSGHNIAASGLQAAFQVEPGVASVRVLDVLDYTNPLYRAVSDDAYFALVDAAPHLVGQIYDTLQQPFRRSPVTTAWDQLNTVMAVAAIQDAQPDLLVCTHFLPAKLMASLRKRGALETAISVVTTDYDFQGLWLSSPFNRFFVARDETHAYMVELGLPGDRITVSGIPVGPAFTQPVDREAVLARYGLRPDLPIVLI